jgi:UDP-N-acetylmuramoylalanine--D-glutamate ligase
LQDEGIHGGIRWINDSISTASESAIMALNAIGQQAQTLVVGGFDRGHDMQNLAEFISNSDLDHVIVLPTTGHRIARNLRARKNDVKLYEVESLAEAVKVAKRVTTPGMACVFSPGAPSYTFFKNFEERGAEFRRQVLLNE